MYARLRPYYMVVGSPLTVSDIYRYAGCIAGLRGLQPISRPVIDYDAVSLDGIVWRPLNELLFMIPWEDPNVH